MSSTKRKVARMEAAFNKAFCVSPLHPLYKKNTSEQYV